jgi:hypothetical protein|nr:MAG TPA: hypothetical protein [Caudoviricetes sp.]
MTVRQLVDLLSDYSPNTLVKFEYYDGDIQLDSNISDVYMGKISDYGSNNSNIECIYLYGDDS